MNAERSTISLWMRFFAIFIGAALLFWFPIEDATETIVILFAILICTLLAATLLVRSSNLSSLPFHSFVLAGILAGAAVTPLTLSLMAFKTGLHAHPVPDYTNHHIISIFRRTPIWMIGGFFTGIGLGIWVKSQQIEPESYHAIER